MVEVRGTREFVQKTDEQLMQAADLQFTPNIEVIDAIFSFYEGYSKENVGTDREFLKTAAGGSVFMATELLTFLIAREIIINPPDSYYIKNNLAVPPPMDGTVVEILYSNMMPSRTAGRTRFDDPFERGTRHALLAGGSFFERWFKNADWTNVRDSMMADEQGTLMPPTDESGNPIVCDLVIQRQFKNLIVNRSYQTGLKLEAPYWVRRDQSETYTEGDYVGPLHDRQGVYFILNKQTETDYYGMGMFAPLLTELENSAKAYTASLILARDTIVPPLIITHQPGLGAEQTGVIDSALTAFHQHTDVTKYRKGFRMPGGMEAKYLESRLRFDEVAKFEEFLQDQIMIWLGIPITLIAPKSNYAVSRIQGKLFEQRINKLRDIIWAGWEDTHFRPLLLEYGVEDWETTPINVGWKVIDMEWDKDVKKTERAENIIEQVPAVQTAVRQLEQVESPLAGVIQ